MRSRDGPFPAGAQEQGGRQGAVTKLPRIIFKTYAINSTATKDKFGLRRAEGFRPISHKIRSVSEIKKKNG